ncbi:MAG: carbohydrate kinase [Desulfobulbaceae bacterium]|nr:carbohydrate kinase [Desulfobulbaceae bacterium]
MIVAIGEIVWDIIAGKRLLGGAPLNVAYHLSSFGLQVRLIGRIGNDELTDLTLRHIAGLGLPVAGIQRDGELPTGRVVVSFGKNNAPSFDIVAPAAWDAIEAEPFLNDSPQPFHLVFGTLAQRFAPSRRTIRSLWDQADLLFYDVNLRPPFTPAEVVLDSLAAADVVKLNEDELQQVADWSGIPAGPIAQRAGRLCNRWQLLCLAVTRGSAGALLVTKDGVFEHGGFPVQVADTVGAGDAFFATLIEGIIHARPWPQCLARANKRGSYVAGRPGATPPMQDFVF